MNKSEQNVADVWNLTIINGVEFTNKAISKADWVDREILCDAYINDVNGVSHNVQHWYNGDVLVLNS